MSLRAGEAEGTRNYFLLLAKGIPTLWTRYAIRHRCEDEQGLREIKREPRRRRWQVTGLRPLIQVSGRLRFGLASAYDPLSLTLPGFHR